jgi:hypothetical protein
MNVTLLKALVVLVPRAILLAGSIALFLRQRTIYSLLQLLGAGSLVVVSSRMKWQEIIPFGYGAGFVSCHSHARSNASKHLCLVSAARAL